MGSNAETGIESPDGAANPIETDYEVGQDNFTTQIGPFGLDVHNPVFLISGLSIVAFVFLTLAFQDSVGPMFNDMRGWLTSTLDWFFLSAANVFVLLCLFLIVSPLGKVRLGGQDATPDYSYSGWFAMLFAAGMGIGLMFYGVSEPISHFTTSMGGAVVGDGGARTDWAPLGGAMGDADAAFDLGMAATIFHWGLHPWAIYATVALALALFSFNKGLPLTMRSVFYPVFGERVWGWTGHVIDIMAVFATLFGLATSLGFGAEQANAGLQFLFGLPESDGSKVFLIIGITGIALISVLAGLDAGVKRLSEINMVLAALLLLFVVLVGPTMDIIKGFFTSLVAYVEYLPALSNPVGREDANFSQGWTSFYWAWWISWSPFVGMFIARVSRGRTVREFITCVLIIPSLVCVLWMTAFGGTAVHMVNEGVQAIADAALPIKLFTMLEQLPLHSITSFIGIVLVIVFFVTSSDSGSLVIDTITAGGKVDAPVPQRIFWCTFEGLVAIALLLGGGLGALQAMAVSTGFPFAIILLLACYSIIQGLRSEPR
ncbi:MULTISPECIES: BCCT family transporter [Thalassospira]|mgnify:FL=1|jgi:BCCT family betaine/carnitine transporter|uniref:BCCT transporter n=1 Tax=Thalassospira xiamenensis TaxID=220697 RepID=A0ABR5Y114_9PROT|nr:MULTISPECIES: BCCT family transporter [Thalassospira]MAL29334.1 BCCT family transporter [Thalassospira sp.]MBR9780883.1 BCCT family transporter [Rhodospirillales bacterium]KZD03553.1 BCCT transporter [Thalassospira xiamenensis]KZD08580.1 BCCT transporter [Thalassospira xiamenensis]MBL4841707.1 BCCT family transporter [Thalassospira sp.]|tara:strand:- start:30401 stop:32032 length:1632 start_codon:yes stop_codon:yes gene_type:complete